MNAVYKSVIKRNCLWSIIIGVFDLSFKQISAILFLFMIPFICTNKISLRTHAKQTGSNLLGTNLRRFKMQMN